VFMDRQYLDCDLTGADAETGAPFRTSLMVDARVVSATSAGLSTVDAGFSMTYSVSATNEYGHGGEFNQASASKAAISSARMSNRPRSQSPARLPTWASKRRHA